MPDEKAEQLRVLHLVSSGAMTGLMQQSAFMPLLTRMPVQQVKAQVVTFAPGLTLAAVLRQNGVPVHDIALSRRRLSAGAARELLAATRKFRPDVIQAWGTTAQLAAVILQARCDWKPKLAWSIAGTAPLAKDAGLIDRQKFKLAVKYSGRADRIIFTSEIAAATHRRMGYPESTASVVPPTVDPTRFKPDFAARRKVREQWELPPAAFVIGMVAPFQPEYDHATLLRGVGELIKTDPNMYVVLAGHGVQKGNGPLMALVGGGTLSTRTRLLGEWSDMTAFYNACDAACSTSLIDDARMTLVMAMLCGVPCVATGIGAQGEVVGRFGVALEPGSATAFTRGILRVRNLSPERRTFMAQNARRHALTHYIHAASLQKYLQLYFDVAGRQLSAATYIPIPEIDASVPVQPTELRAAAAAVGTPPAVSELSDPDSLETPVRPAAVEIKPAPLPVSHRDDDNDGDVLQMYESRRARMPATASAMSERARGVPEEQDDLLAPEALQAAAPEVPKPAAPAPAQLDPPAEPSATSGAMPEKSA